MLPKQIPPMPKSVTYFSEIGTNEFHAIIIIAAYILLHFSIQNLFDKIQIFFFPLAWSSAIIVKTALRSR